MDMYALKILVCDDSLLVRKRLKTALLEQGFQHVLEAADGNDAVSVCAAEHPDLVFMDIVMPNKDGLEALKEIKQNNPATYVVMASSVGTQSNLITAIKLGAYNFIQKPITIDGVMDVVQKILKEREEI